MGRQVQQLDRSGGGVHAGLHGRAMARGAAVLACAAMAVATGTGGAQASPASVSMGNQPQVVVTHETFRLGDGDNQLLVFANKTRAELCTPERITFEIAFEAWLDGGAVGEPPTEPADSSAGIAEVTRTTTQAADVTSTTIVGDDLPVEVWRLDDEPGGIDCTATDGPGAELFATGEMDFRVRSVQTASTFRNDIRLGGTVRDTAGTPWSYLIRYTTQVVDGQDPVFTEHIALKAKR